MTAKDLEALKTRLLDTEAYHQNWGQLSVGSGVIFSGFHKYNAPCLDTAALPCRLVKGPCSGPSHCVPYH